MEKELLCMKGEESNVLLKGNSHGTHQFNIYSDYSLLIYLSYFTFLVRLEKNIFLLFFDGYIYLYFISL